MRVSFNTNCSPIQGLRGTQGKRLRLKFLYRPEEEVSADYKDIENDND